MPRVQLLEKSVAERIAAGEVVERPVSIVKELVENSLDAAASRVTVELQAGGMTLVRVTDDGHGMSEEDARLAVQRFATSKIRQWEDLDELMTLGFRGEALPSIAAVARVEIQTCEPGAEQGTELRLEGSEILRVAPAPAVPGTRITVRDLFFNTPARRKFLRSPAAETSQVVDLLGRLAAAWPEVHFRLVSNSKELLSFPAGLSAPERLSRMWKVPVDRLLSIQGQGQGLLVDGLVALPPESRTTRACQIFLMNGRVIRSTSLSQALHEGFSPWLERGRFPVGLVRLTVDPSLVDVNVHPTKLEVRFAQPRPVFSALYRAVSEALGGRGASPVPPHDLPRAGEEAGGRRQEAGHVLGCAQGAGAAPLTSGPGWRSVPRAGPVPAARPQSPSAQAVLEFLSPLGQDRVGEPRPSRFVPLTQLHETWVVGLIDGDLCIIDQHAAHERVNYERLDGSVPLEERSQGLPVPEVLELAPALAGFLAGNLELFRSLGFVVEPFGGDAFQLRAVPAGLSARRVADAFRDLVEAAAASAVQEGFPERLRAMVSCRAAVKAGDPLTRAEMTHLVEDTLAVEPSSYLPHGRPTRILLDRGALERLFHR